MRRIALLAALLLCAAPALADPEGSVAPGNRAPRSALTGCTHNSAGVAVTDGQQVATQCDASGNVNVNIGASTGLTGLDLESTQLQVLAALNTLIAQALPIGVTPTITNTTVTTGGTFQSALAASATRKGCFIVNIGANAGKVFSGTTGTSHAGYLPVPADYTYPCAGTLTVDQGNIDYTSTTTGDAFAVWSW